MENRFQKASHTLVLSDIHLADAEPPHPKNPLWKRFKRPRYFIDRTFRKFLDYWSSQIDGPIELVLNGDIFDFDSIMEFPKEEELAQYGNFSVNWLERRRGLAAEEPKSRFKMNVIIHTHAVFFTALSEFIAKGNRVVFVIGNHDMELHWPSVRQVLFERLADTEELRERVRFCEWFYVSNNDTLIEHGNQYDAYCLASNPINPLIRIGSRVSVRIPFGNLAGKYMLNGMGLMNPHADSSFIRGSIKDYVVFYYKYMVTTQPLLPLTWFWSAVVTLLYSLSEGFLPALTDPLTIGSRIEEIAQRSNSTSRVVWSLRELHAHPAIFNPLKIARELWLDRAILLGLILFGSFQLFSFLNLFTSLSWVWVLIPIGLLLPIFMFYARSVQSEVDQVQKQAFHMAPIAAQIVGVQRVVQGHVHRERHTWVGSTEYLNSGTWSPAYHDVECTQPYGRKCFVWIKPNSEAPDGPRIAELYEWTGSESVRIEATPWIGS